MATDEIKDGSIKAYIDAGTATFTNKTFNANGTGNVLSNVEVADFAASAIVTEAESITSNDNDTTLPTSAAVKDHVDVQRDISYAADAGAAAINTSVAETTILSSAISIPAGTLKSTGDRIYARIVLEQKNNTGSAVTFTHRLKVGGQTITGLNAYSQATNGFTPRCYVVAEVVRTSATTLIGYMKTSLTSPLNTTELAQNTATGSLTVSNMDSNATAVDFTIQMGTSNAQAEVDPSLVIIRVERV